MRGHRVIIFIAVLALIGGGAGTLTWLKKTQRLGPPGIKTTPIPSSIKLKFDLPAHVLNYTSEREQEAGAVTNTLPKDTSFAQRRYTAPDGFWVNANIVLMGMDRTSIHKPEFCLPGQGWRIDKKETVNIPISGMHPYQLRVAKWTITNFIQNDKGQRQKINGLYVFWFVAKNEETDSHWQRIWWLTRDLLTTGVLQRWAYVSYFVVCQPGQEEAAFGRIKKLIAASVPEFQLPPDTK
jgi:Protein of unknown function (DUF3485)